MVKYHTKSKLSKAWKTSLKPERGVAPKSAIWSENLHPGNFSLLSSQASALEDALLNYAADDRLFDTLFFSTSLKPEHSFNLLTRMGMIYGKNRGKCCPENGNLRFEQNLERVMDHVEVTLYLYRRWAEELAIAVRNANLDLLGSLKEPERQKCLKGALREISDALSEAGI